MASPVKPSVLVVEDEPPQMELLAYNLQNEGFEVMRAEDGEVALLAVAEDPPDLIVLDWMLPNVSGIEVCRQIKAREETRSIPVIMLTARGEESDRIRGLDTGADDYVVKPYSVRELVARVRAGLRRAKPSQSGQKLSYGDISLDAEQHRVYRAGTPVHLGPIEYRLLCTLIERPGRVWSRDQLLDLVWGRDSDVDHRTVDVHVGRLRKALRLPGLQEPIRTVRGAGYSLDQSD